MLFRSIVRAALLACTLLSASSVWAEEARTSEAKALGAQAADTVLKHFLATLKGALEEGGVTHAVSFCNVHAPGLADKVRSGLPNGITFKRVSEKIRNPVNSPDGLEMEALLRFEQELAATGLLPSYFLQRVDTPAFKGYRYYAPIKVAPLCLACHGESSSLSPEVQKVLRERYPKDDAVGYQVGDFRGLLRVGIPDYVLSTQSGVPTTTPTGSEHSSLTQ